MPIALAGRCIVAYLATRCHRAESDCATRAAWPATAQPLVYHHSRMALVDIPQSAVDLLTPHLAALADAEGFPEHRRSAEIRVSS